MSVQQRLMANGAFDVPLRDIPRSTLDALPWLATVVFTSPAVDEDLLGSPTHPFPGFDVHPATTVYPDTHPLLKVARWSGVLIGASPRSLRGYGLAWWLGDEDKGEPFEAATTFGGVPLAKVIPRLLPRAILPGTVHDTGEVFVGHVGQYQMPRPAIEYVSQVMRTEWRVNPDGTFDAGTESQLFTNLGMLVYPGNVNAPVYPSVNLYPQSIVPAAIAVPKKYAGVDIDLETLEAASLEAEFDAEDYVSGVMVVGENLAAATAETVSPYRGPQGNPVRRIKLISDPETDTVNLVQRATVEAQNLAQIRTAVSLTVDNYDITDPAGQAPASADVGATIWVYDPDEGLFDTLNPVGWRGQTVYPVALRILGATRPVTSDVGVYVANTDGTWFDITPYVSPEAGSASLEVGATKRTLLNLSKQREAFRARVAAATVIDYSTA